jgi:putative copper export protein
LAGTTLTLGAGALAILLSNLRRFAVLAPVGAVAMSASFGLTGHTQGLDNPGLMPIAAAVHVLIAGFWLAAPLSLWPRRALADALLARRLRQFSAIALAAIPILVILGVSLAWTLARGRDGLLHTAYGALLLLKLAASLVAIVVGAINHKFVARLVTTEPEGGRKWLASTLSIEAVMFVAAVLIVSAATTFTGPAEG